jgi:hypothetical protein
MCTTTRTWRSRGGTLFGALVLFCCGTVPSAQAGIVEITKAQVDGSPLYNGAATRIFRFDAGDANPTVARIAAVLDDAGRAIPAHCERVDDPPGGEGTVRINGVEFLYVRTGNGNVYFDWSANAPVMFINVEAGDRAYVYAYPAAALADTGLRGPERAELGARGFRHFDFCFRNRPPTITRTVTAQWQQHLDWERARYIDQPVDQFGKMVAHEDTTNRPPTAAAYAHRRYRMRGVIEVKAQAGTATVDLDSFASSLILRGDGRKAIYRLEPYDCVRVALTLGYGVIARCRFDTDYVGNPVPIRLDSRSKHFLHPGVGGVNAASATVTFLGRQSTITTGPANVAFEFPVDPVSGGDSSVRSGGVAR